MGRRLFIVWSYFLLICIFFDVVSNMCVVNLVLFLLGVELIYLFIILFHFDFFLVVFVLI